MEHYNDRIEARVARAREMKKPFTVLGEPVHGIELETTCPQCGEKWFETFHTHGDLSWKDKKHCADCLEDITGYESGMF